MSDPNTLVLIKASPQQVRMTWRNTCAQWSKGLEEAKYFERETLLASQGMTKDRLTVWVLVEEANKSDPEAEPLAHLETFDRSVLVRPNGPGGAVEERGCISIATVFSPPHHRGMGYGKRMVTLLYAIIPKITRLPPWASALYSDIGEDFYGRVGWKAYPSYDLVWPVEADQGAKLPENVLYIASKEEIERIVQEDRRALEKEVANAPSNCNPVAITPTQDIFLWHHAREVFYAEIASLPVPSRMGASITYSSSFLLWTHDFSLQALVILRSRFARTEDAIVLEAAAQAEARAYGLTQITTWLPTQVPQEEERGVGVGIPETWAAVSTKVALVERSGGISSLALFPPSPDQATSPTRWIGNEKYGWV